MSNLTGPDHSQPQAALSEICKQLSKELGVLFPNSRVHYLAQGGEATSFKIDCEDGRTVVARCRDIGRLQAYNYDRETQALDRLDHRALCKPERTPSEPSNTYAFLDEGKIYATFREYAEGQSLRDFVLQGQKLNTHSAISILKQVLDCLDYLHANFFTDGRQRTLVVRDIKSSNIIVDDNLNIKIIDIGSITGLENTFTSNRIFSQGYAAPEWPATPVSDLYSVGIMAVECSFGGMPEMLTSNGYFSSDKQYKIPSDSNIHPSLARFLQKMIDKRPAYRFQSAKQALQELSLVELEIERGGTSLQHEAFSSFARSARWWALLSALTVGSAGVSRILTHTEPDPSKESESISSDFLLPLGMVIGDSVLGSIEVNGETKRTIFLRHAAGKKFADHAEKMEQAGYRPATRIEHSQYHDSLLNRKAQGLLTTEEDDVISMYKRYKVALNAEWIIKPESLERHIPSRAMPIGGRFDWGDFASLFVEKD